MKKIIGFTILCMLLSVQNVSAHVTVKPNSAKPGSYQTFVMAVPVETDSPTIGIKLLVPSGVSSVRPNVKPGWKIEIEKSGEITTAITWKGGRIPVDFRDEFIFSAKVPSQPTSLPWKTYITSADGQIAAWDMDPNEEKKTHTAETAVHTGGSYSVTAVASESATGLQSPQQKSIEIPVMPLIVGAAITIAVVAFLKRSK